MVVANIQLAGVVILAGGNSKRMGSPKAKLRLLSGETLLDYHVRHAIELNVPIIIADNERGFKVDEELMTHATAPIFHIKDYGQNDTGGALVAIESALQALIPLVNNKNSAVQSAAYLMVISCDSLIKATELWPQLSAAIDLKDNNKSVVCLSDDSHLYPLLALYQLAIEHELRAYLDSGQRRVMRFIEPICQKVAFDSQWQDLTNFNTPEDFAKACQALYQNI
ncbi:molybdenum cofactor guanylyltransferase [Psychrobacter sp. 1U2]|uniref:molybdenum cofactor guanylyltransferase n=1 Tax=Psychrobacter sp. 1U2 TaxID=3453577 RepID=UPI003F47B8C7